MTVEGRGHPSMDAALADHRCRNFQYDCRYVPLAEEVLSVLPGLGGEAFLLCQRRAKLPKRLGITGEKIGCKAGERLDAVFPRNLRARHAGGDKLAFDTFERLRTGRKTDLEMLQVIVSVAVRMFDRAKFDLESEFFFCVSVQIEAKGVNRLIPEGVGSRQPGVRIHGQRHDGVPLRSFEEIEVADVDPGIFSRCRSIEVMGHVDLALNSISVADTKLSYALRRSAGSCRAGRSTASKGTVFGATRCTVPGAN